MNANRYKKLIRGAVDRVDIELLIKIWKNSLTKKNGQVVRDYITDNLPRLSKELHIPEAKTFRQLIHAYDLQQLEQEPSIKNVVEKISSIGDLLVLRDIATRARVLVLNKFKLGEEEWRKLFYKIMIEKALKYDDVYTIDKLSDSIRSWNGGGVYFGYYNYVSDVLLEAINKNAPKILVYVITTKYPKGSLKAQFFLRSTLWLVIDKNKIDLVEALLEKTKDLHYQVSSRHLQRSVELESPDIFQLLLDSDLVKQKVFTKWDKLLPLLEKILKRNVEEADDFLDILFDYLDHIDSPLYNKAVNYVENN